MKQEMAPPQWVDWLLEKLAPSNLVEEIKGDLFESFLHDINHKNIPYAKRKYVINAVGFLFKQFFWKNSIKRSNPSPMFNSYFKMASRSLMAYKNTALINIIGLVIGLTASIVILAVIQYELSFDSFHTNSDRIYRLVRVSGSDMSEFRAGISYPVPAALKDNISAIQKITSLEYLGDLNIDVVDQNGSSVRMFKEERGVALVDSLFFDVLDFKGTTLKWISGNPNNALNEPFSVVLTKSLAKKYFETDQALGKTLRLAKQIECKVSGVIEDFPPNTDFPFSMLVSYITLKKLNGRMMSDWVSVNDENQAYLVLPQGVTKEELELQIAKVHAANTSKDIHENRHYLLQPLKELHTDARFGNFSRRTISKQTILALGLIGIFLILTACINYINLATAQATLRAKEIGLRKVMGGNQTTLIFQFLVETFIVVLLAGILASGLSELLVINLNSLLNLPSGFSIFQERFILLTILLTIIGISLLAGLYPALAISKFNPVTSLKNKFTTETFAGLSLRKVLVVIQFTLTQMLVVGTSIVISQMNFFQNSDMGFNAEAILNASVGNNKNIASIKVFENQLRSLPVVENVSFTSTLPSGASRNRSYGDIGRSNATDSKDFVIYEHEVIDPSYLDLFEIKLLAGRNLRESDSIGNVLINRTLMNNLGWTDPAQCLSQELKGYGGKYTVVGVVNDFYSNSLKEVVDNIMMAYKPRSSGTVSIKLNVRDGESMMDAVTQIEKIWKANFPEYIFDYGFFDENIKSFYHQEQKYSRLFQLFSVIFLLIGCLGLYGLVAFVVNRKSKEVAIRRVLGATVNNILILFSKEYMLLIAISFIIAVPVTYYSVNNWLSNFAQHIELHWWRFTVPGFLVLGIALLVVTVKSLKTANTNPVEKLKED